MTRVPTTGDVVNSLKDKIQLGKAILAGALVRYEAIGADANDESVCANAREARSAIVQICDRFLQECE